MRGAGLGTTIDGTWSEMIIAPDQSLGLLPDDICMELGACFFSPCTAAWIALHELARVSAGERLLIAGATGAVGSIAAQIAVQAGAKVFGVFDEVAKASDLPSAVVPVSLNEAADCHCDVLLDTIAGRNLARRLSVLRSGGRAVLVGHAAGAVSEVNVAELIQTDVTVLPLNMIRREASARAVAPTLLKLLAQGRLELSFKAFPLAAAADALQHLQERGRRARIVLLPDQQQ
jgi:NADPH2:quinone reductase